MRLLVLLSVALFMSVSCAAQNDLLILKKNNRTIQSFFPGSEMDFSTASRYFEGMISEIKRDSVFLIQYDVRHVYAPNLGVYVLDTISAYHYAVGWKDIIAIGKDNHNFNWSASGATLFGGGVLLTTAGLVTWIFAKPNTRYYARPALVIGSAVLGGIGYLLLKSGHKSIKLGKKYTLRYIKLK
ncbi:MAG: hypothetical protein ACTHNG_11540 [Ginsengibacter sp.]